MTIRQKLSIGTGILLTLFLALGIITYFQIGQIDENLTEIIKGKELGQRVAFLYYRCKALEKAANKKRNNQDRLFATAAENFEKIDNIISERIREKIDLKEPDGHEKMLVTFKMEADISEAAAWLGIYLQSPEKIYKKSIFDSAGNFEQEFNRFNNLNLTKEEKDNLTKLDSVFHQNMSLVKEILELHDYLQENASEHRDARANIDELLDEEFEVFTRTDLEYAKISSRRMVGTAVIVTLILVLTGFLDVFVFSAAITRSITKPIIKLKNAMTEIGKGDFDTKIEIDSKDEIGQLAACFNKMTEDLKESTTSITELNAEITKRKKAQEALQKAHNNLEVSIEQRTAELAQSNKNLELEIAERKRAEEDLEKLNIDLDSTVRELSRSNKELQEFAYVAAHDLKTPLRAIATLADWISSDYADRFDEKGKEQINLLVTRAKQTCVLVDDILHYSRVGKTKQEKQEVDLNTLLSEVICGIAPPENIEITIENELPTIICEKTQIIQVFQNLLSNAVKYMDKPQGHIKISCVEENGFWKFVVTDNGPGIEQKYFKRIFKIFQTLSPRDRDDSTGIGLSIVKKIVELNAGKVWVESELDKGSTFFFTLPKSKSDYFQEASIGATSESTK